MSNTRPNPLDLNGIAKEMAEYLKEVKPEVFMALFNGVTSDYKGDNLWFPIRIFSKMAFYFTRTRTPELTKATTVIEELMKADEQAETKSDALESANGEHSQSILELIAELLKTGNWKDTSVNTNVVRGVLTKLPNPEYANIQMTLAEINDLKKPLLEEFQIQLENKVEENKKKINQITIVELQKDDDLKATRLNIFRKEGEIFLTTSEFENNQNPVLEESIIFEDEKLNKQKELAELKLQLENLVKEIQALKEEKQKNWEEIEAAKKAIMLLAPESAMQNFGIEENAALVNELTQVGKDAIKMHLFNKKNVLERNVELKLQPKIEVNKSALQSKFLLTNEKTLGEHKEKMKEVERDCAVGDRDIDSIKFKLNNMLINNFFPKPSPPKNQTPRKVIFPKTTANPLDFKAELKNVLRARKIDDSQAENETASNECNQLKM